MLFKLGIFVFGLVSASDNCSRRHSEYNDYVATAALDGEASELIAKTANVDTLLTTTPRPKCREDVCEVYFSLKKKVLEEMVAAAASVAVVASVPDVESTVTEEATREASVSVHNPNAPTLRSEKSTVTAVAQPAVEPVKKKVAKPVTPPKPVHSAARTLFEKIVHMLLNDSKRINDPNIRSDYYCGNGMPDVVDSAGFVLGTLVKCNAAKRKFESVRSQPSSELTGGRRDQYDQFVANIGSHFGGETSHKISQCEIDLCNMSYLTAAAMAVVSPTNPNNQNVETARSRLVELLRDIGGCNRDPKLMEIVRSAIAFIEKHLLPH